MTITDWSEFYSTFTIECGYGKPVPKPTIAQLDQFETETKLKLPKSYRDFIQIFGPGEISVVLRIAAPGYPYLPWSFDLLSASKNYGYEPNEIARSGLPEAQQDRLKRLFYFGRERGRLWLGWDPLDVRDSISSEYGIYLVEFACDILDLVAISFRHLIEETCEFFFAPDPEWDEEVLGPKQTFHPAGWLPPIT